MAVVVNDQYLSAMGASLQSGIQGTSGLPLAIDPRYGTIFFDDFMTAQGSGDMEWVLGVNGTSSGGGATGAVQGEFGVAYNGAQGNGGASNGYHYIALTGFLPAYGKTYVEIKMRTTTLSDVTDPYLLYMGLGDTTAHGDQNDGVYFLYDQATNGDYWAGKAAGSGTRTSLVFDGGGGRATAAVTGSASHTLGLVINDSTSVDFYVGRSYKGSITTNLPDTTESLGFIMKLDKTTGANTRNFVVDYFYCAHIFSTPR
jgi:hypothetical protein